MGTLVAQLGCEPAAAPASAPASTASPKTVDPMTLVIESPPGTPRPPFTFDDEDAAFLDEVQEATFGYLWAHVGPKSGMVYDRTHDDVISVAGVGFQLGALPVAVDRGWIEEREARERAERILTTLLDNPANRWNGLFYHFIDDEADPARVGSELVVSTIDSAILFAGAMTAASAFGGETEALVDRMLEDADWSAFVIDDPTLPVNGFISLGWRPHHDDDPTGEGELLPYAWIDAADEQRLVAFLAAAAPIEAHRVGAKHYYALRRTLGDHADIGPMAWFPYSGAYFTAVFAHCWIPYAHLEPDDPSAFGANARARVDWWENSRRLTRLHQIKCERNADRLPTLGVHAWGVSASDGPRGYQVLGVFPDPLPMAGALPGADYATERARDNFGDGTIAPYAAGSAIMFDPGRAIAALRHYRQITDESGRTLAWAEPSEGGHGYLDAFNVGDEETEAWAAAGHLAIDQGPLFLAIENARTGRVWQWFASHPAAAAGFDRLGWTIKTTAASEP